MIGAIDAEDPDHGMMDIGVDPTQDPGVGMVMAMMVASDAILIIESPQLGQPMDPNH